LGDTKADGLSLGGHENNFLMVLDAILVSQHYRKLLEYTAISRLEEK
jgi:hypothetical protein